MELMVINYSAQECESDVAQTQNFAIIFVMNVERAGAVGSASNFGPRCRLLWP